MPTFSAGPAAILPGRGGAAGIAAQLGELCLERQIAGRLRLVARQRRGNVVGAGQVRQHVRRSRRLHVVEDVAADARPMHASHLRVMRVGDDRGAELELALGEARRIGHRGNIRHHVVGRVQAVGIDTPEIVDRGQSAVVDLALGDPYRRVAALRIERIERRSFFFVAHQAVELAAGEFAQLLHDRVDRRRRRGRSCHSIGGRLATLCRRRFGCRRVGCDRDGGRRGGCRHLVSAGTGRRRLLRRSRSLRSRGGIDGGNARYFVASTKIGRPRARRAQAFSDEGGAWHLVAFGCRIRRRHRSRIRDAQERARRRGV